MSDFFFYLENGRKHEEPIETENPSKNYLEFSETEVVEDDCRDGCKDKAYFYDNGQMAIRNRAKGAKSEILNEILNVLKKMGKEFNEKIGALTGQIQTLSKTLIDSLSNAKSDSSESVSNLIEFNPELPEDPIVTEDLSKTNPDLSKTEVAKDDCRDGCKDKAYFYDEGVEEKPTHHNENLNVLKQINDLSETDAVSICA